MEIIFSSLHHIDIDGNKVDKVEFQENEHTKTYFNKLFETITTSPNKKTCEIPSRNTEVIVSLNKIISKETQSDAPKTNAERLLKKEIAAQRTLASRNLSTEVLKGSLFQAQIEVNGEEKMILCKADHKLYLDDDTMGLRSGLPWEKKIFKAALFHIENGEILKEVDILDENFSKYWWREFLELEEKYTDEHNTEESMDDIDSRVFSYYKNHYPSDYYILRNSFVGYFRTKNSFEVEDFISTLFENYTPIDEALPIDKMVDKIRKLPDSRGFDKSFTISKSSIKKRRTDQTIRLTSSIDLKTKGHVEDFKGAIESDKNDEGQMFVKIKIDDEKVYESFKR